MPTNGFSIKPLKIKLLAGEQKAAEVWFLIRGPKWWTSEFGVDSCPSLLRSFPNSRLFWFRGVCLLLILRKGTPLNSGDCFTHFEWEQTLLLSLSI